MPIGHARCERYNAATSSRRFTRLVTKKKNVCVWHETRERNVAPKKNSLKRKHWKSCESQKSGNHQWWMAKWMNAFCTIYYMLRLASLLAYACARNKTQVAFHRAHYTGESERYKFLLRSSLKIDYIFQDFMSLAYAYLCHRRAYISLCVHTHLYIANTIFLSLFTQLACYFSLDLFLFNFISFKLLFPVEWISRGIDAQLVVILHSIE